MTRPPQQAVNHEIAPKGIVMGPGRDPELARALKVAGQYLEEYCQYIIASSKQVNPYILERSSRERGGDNTTRARVRALAVGVHAIFGAFLYGTLATVGSVALQTDIDAKSVKNWCSAKSPTPLLVDCQ